MNAPVTDLVRDRYAAGAKAREEALCCPVEYDEDLLKAIPREVLERDYGCGDPSHYIQPGETVLDLGSGSGKICFIASQIVGAQGKIIGVDMTAEMLDLARRNAPEVARAVGYANTEFRRGTIQDLRTDLDALDSLLAANPVKSAEDYQTIQAEIENLKQTAPLIADNTIDVVVSNCVLNLVGDAEKRQLFSEIHRVLKPGGRIAISDIVSDEPSPAHLKADPDLWSGCVSGALQEHEFVRALEDAGFYGVTLDKRDEQPWRIVEGIEYRAITVLAWKGKEGPCIDKNHAVVYRGPWKTVEDDDGHVYHRGQRMAVCEKTFKIMTREPYARDMIPVEPAIAVTEERVFDCSRPTVRDPSETKQGVAPVTTEGSDCCGPTSSCC
ncbi:MAG TPA: methyltransferase domain-containing protein [Alphaproteobacteria bacterium]|nr:methyltransferase domain-containing protein [Alphaproteobacteria bacterium]